MEHLWADPSVSLDKLLAAFVSGKRKFDPTGSWKDHQMSEVA